MGKRALEKTDEGPAKKVAPIFSPRVDRPGRWTVIPNSLMVFTPSQIDHRTKICGFDLDGTLIKTKSGNVFPKDETDWQLWDFCLPKKLKEKHNDGYKICIFTNQKGIEKGKVNVGAFKKKIENICDKIGVPIEAFISPGDLSYRKPYVGMWEYLEEQANNGVIVDRNESIYVGDAAGRLKTNSRKKADHSSADRLFALNLGVEFQTPEQFFFGDDAVEPYKLPPFDPNVLFNSTVSQFEPVDTQFPNPGASSELILLVGCQASGKSTLSKWLHDEFDYEIVNQDTLGSLKTCLSEVRSLLDEGKNVVVDNTNKNVETRVLYLNIAASLGVPCRVIVMNCPLKQAMHNNTYRRIIGADKAHKTLENFVIRQFFNGYKPPTETEGFQEVIHCNFIPKFENDTHSNIYKMYLVE